MPAGMENCAPELAKQFCKKHGFEEAVVVALTEKIKENIEKINKLYDQGNTIVYWTARGSRKQIDWTNLTRQQLEDWGAKYHELRVDKPFYDLFIEDKSLRIEEV